MRSLFFKLFVGSAMLAGLPLLGIALAGHPLGRYLQFPPRTHYVAHAPFSGIAFVLFSVFTAAAVLPPAIRWARAGRRREPRGAVGRPFPRWGWMGVAGGVLFWVLAWTRLPFFSVFQPHTFTPLWLSYIVVVNACTYRRSGQCLLCRQSVRFLALFPLSAVFWWFFEYLNRFVQNWYYPVSQYGPWTYFALATLSFSTVLPAVASTREWILTGERFTRAFRRHRALTVRGAPTLAWTALILSGTGLAAIGAAPDLLFPLLWVSPLLIIVSLQVLLGEPHIFSSLSRGRLAPGGVGGHRRLDLRFFLGDVELWESGPMGIRRAAGSSLSAV
jgi:hypothetical protein